MQTAGTATRDATQPKPSWPTVRIRLSRPEESVDSMFVQIERHCPMGRGQRCLVLAPGQNAAPKFLSEMSDRIRSLNPELEVRILRAIADKSAADADAAIETAESAVREGRHFVLVLDSLNALAAHSADSIGACERVFGAAQATENAGTATIVALAAEPATTDLDREILRRFRGAGNMELALRFGEKAGGALSLDASRSGTKHAERIQSPG